MGKKGKGKGKGQPSDSSQASGDKPKRAPQQVYQPPSRRAPQESSSQPQERRPREEPAKRDEPGPSQESLPEQPSVAYRKPSQEEAQPPPTPVTASKGVGRGRGAPMSQKVGPPTGGFFEKEAGVGRGPLPPQSQKVEAPTSGIEKETAPKKKPPPEAPPETLGKKTKASGQKKVLPEEELGFKFKGLSTSEPARIDFIKRPDYGKLGVKIGLYVNYFKLEYKHRTVYHYDIDISEATKDQKMGESLMSRGRTAKEDIAKKVKHVERQKRRNIGKAKCRQIISAMIKSKALQQYSPVYDGQKNLFTNKPLPFKEKISIQVDVSIDDVDKKYFVTIQPVIKADKTNIIDMQPLIELYNKRSREIPLEVLLVYETIMNHRDPPFKQVQYRNSFFALNRENVCNLGLGMEIWFGYNQSVHLTERGPVVIINLAAKAFHKAGRVIDYANDVLECDVTRTPRLAAWQHEALEKALKGLSVKVTHQKHARKYKIKGLSKVPAKDIKFESEGREISIVDYFLRQYNIRLQHPLLPCLHMQTSNPKTFIPMEVCNVVEGQPKIGKLSGDMTARMIKSTAVPPDSRFRSITEDAKKVRETSKSYLDAYGLIMDVNLMKVDGRLITAPRLQYDGRDAAPDNRGVWRIEDGKKFYRVVNIKSWGLISFADERRFGMDVLSDYCKYLVRSAQKCGMQMDRPQFINICPRNVSTEKAISEAKKSGIDVAIVVLNRRDRNHTYDEVKFLADFKYRLVTQCMEDKTLGRINDQITTNVCLKLNVKLGGINHILKHDLSMFRSPVMVMGADAIHWTRGIGYPSIVSVVASYEPTANKYMLVCEPQRNERSGRISQEIINNMKGISSELIEAFRVKANGHYPQKIIVFRDGVSEGQFQHAIDYEVSGLQEACQQVIGKVIPITYIVVQKRHQTRIRPQNPGQGVGRGKNIPPGTVVDRDITHPVFFDFFVCSHEGIQGTSKPAHYHVLHDDSRFNADELQKLCHFLCHTFVRCTRSVSLPAPVLYADLACFRAKQYADLFINPDDASVSSSGEEIQREFPDNVAQAIRSMKSFENNMFYV